MKRRVFQKRKYKAVLLTLSFILSMLLWLFAVDPVTEVQISIPVRVNGLTDNSFIADKSIMVVDSKVPQTVKLTLRGRESYLKKVETENFATVLDYSSVETANVKSIDLSQPIYSGGGGLTGVRMLNIKPSSVRVKLKQIDGNTFPLEIKTIGKPAKNYKVLSVSAEPSVIQLNADDSVLSRAARVIAYVDVSGASANSLNQVSIQVLDDEGIIITSENDKYYADVTLTVGKQVRIVPDITGRPNDKYTFSRSKVRCKPNSVVVTGSSQILRNLKSISTDQIDVTDLDHTTTIDVVPVLPNGVSLYNKLDTVRVTLPLKNVEIKTVRVYKRNIILANIHDDYYASILNYPKKITLTGSAKMLKKIKSSDVRFNINMDGAELGTADYGLLLESTDDLRDIKLVGDYKAKIRVTERK